MRLRTALAALRSFFSRVPSYLVIAFGRFDWAPPPWARKLGAAGAKRTRLAYGATRKWALANKPRAIAVGVAGASALAAGGYFYHWYVNRPAPSYASIAIDAPELTPIRENAKPLPLVIRFGESVAQLKDLVKPVARGVRLQPKVEGEWRWQSDRILAFQPKEDWAIGQVFEVVFDKGFFPSHVLLASYRHSFQTATFTASFTEARFYQNPLNPREKRVVATLRFSHPVDPEGLKKRVTFRLKDAESGILKSLGGKTVGAAVTFGKLNAEAYLQSDPIPVPERESVLVIGVGSGVRALRGGPGTPNDLENKVDVPGKYTFFKIAEAGIHVVTNEKFEPEHVLTVEASTEVGEAEIRKNLSVVLLPQDRPAASRNEEARKNFPWSSAGEVSDEVLKQAQPVKLELIPNEQEASPRYSFRIPGAAIGRYVMVRVAKGTRSAGDFVLANEYAGIERVPEFPAEVRFMNEGSVLSLSGERRLSVLSRGVPGLQFEIARVIPTQLNHLVTRGYGDFKNLRMDEYTVPESSVTERFTEERELDGADGGRTQYSVFDFRRFLEAGEHAANKRGLFFLRVRSWDPEKKRALDREDRRFVLVTDLGLLAKSGADRSHDVFVQSVHRGAPVGGARVEVIGKNGLPVVSATTDEQGHAHFPSLTDFRNEKEPVAYVVRKDNDLSFLPFATYDRKLNYTRFDVGGVEAGGDPAALSAFLFSDRGIYRPGDEFRVGMIVRSQDWRQPLEGLPLEAEVVDSRGMAVFKEKLQLEREGFTEIRFRTEEVAPTGAYSASLYLVNEKGERGPLVGQTTVRVEEFLPDTMKISSHLSSESADGWVSPDGLKATVSLRNLFGTPAENRKIAATLRLVPVFPSFRKYPEHRFFDPARAEKSYDERLDDAVTDAKGEAAFALDLSKYQKASYRLIFSAEGFEAEGGRAVRSESAVSVSPLRHLVGYKADGTLDYVKKGSVRTVELIAIDPAAAKVKLDGLTAELIERKTVTVLAKKDDGTYRYESVRKETSLSKRKMSIPREGLKQALASDRPGDFTLSLRDAEGVELQRIDYTVVGPTSLVQKLERNAELQVKLARSDVAQDEELEFQVVAPYTGAGLITIEREKVHAFKWFRAATTSSVQRIRVPRSLEGNGYLNVTFVRSIDSKEIFTSPLSYAAVPFSVSRARRTNALTLDAPERAKPGETVRIGYAAKRPGKIAVFAVDEGILQVAGYKTPDPLGHFFRKRSLQVDTRQLLDLILPEYSVVKELSAAGGDADRSALGKNLNPFKRKRDVPAVYWSGIIDADATRREVSYRVPDSFNGTLRIMAVAASVDAVGVAETKTTVRDDLVITPNVPVLATPGDELEVGVSVANGVEGSGPQAKLDVKLELSEHLTAIDGATRALAVGEGREGSAAFKVRALDKPGSATLTFVATLGKKTSRHSVELSLRPATPYMTTLASGSLKSSEKDLPVARKLYPHYREREVAVSALPFVLSNGLLKYLEEYPYGCTEQLVSRAFPALVLRSSPELGFAPAKAEKSLREAVRALRSRQDADGGFGIWSSESALSEFYTAYAYHFMTEAADLGYPVPKELIRRTEDYAKLRVRRAARNLADVRIAAYLTYLLARNGVLVSNELVAIRKDAEEKDRKGWAKDLAGIFLAATYKLYKQESEAEALIRQVRVGDPVEADYANYYDGLARDAQLVNVLARHFPERLKRLEPEEIEAFVKPVQAGRYNTVSSALTILALRAIAQAAGNKPQEASVVELQAGGKSAPLALSSGTFARAKVSELAEKLRISDRSGAPLFYQLTEAGFDAEAPKKELKQKLEVHREITAVGGGSLGKAKLGDTYEVHVRLRALERGGASHVAVVDLIPSGFEVVLDRKVVAAPDVPPASAPREREEGEEGEAIPPMPEENPADARVPGSVEMLAAEGTTWRPEHADVREDRVLLFGQVGEQVEELVYRIRAVAKGQFTVPPIFAEGMYDRAIQARGVGGRISVEGR